MEDARIIEMYIQRSEQAIFETRGKYGGLIRGIAYRILRSREDATECEDDTYLKTWNAIPPERPRIFSAFLSKIARNLALDRYDRARAQKRGGGEIPLLLDELAECLPGGEGIPEAEDGQLRELLNRWLATLKEESRVMFMQRYWYGYSIEEIARAHGCREGKVKTGLMRARQALKHALEQEGYRL